MANKKLISKIKTEELCDKLVEYEDMIDDIVYKLNGLCEDIDEIKGKIDDVVGEFMEDV